MTTAAALDLAARALPSKDEEQPADLYALAQAALDAARAFREACVASGHHGAVRWLTASDGSALIFTRGEYLQEIIGNIPSQSPEIRLTVGLGNEGREP